MNYINYSSFPTFNKALLYLTYLIWTKISNVKQFWEQFYKHIELASKFTKSRVRSLQTYLPLQMSIWSQFLSTFSSYRCFSRTIYNAISFELRKRLLFNYLSPIQLENKFNQIVDSFFFLFIFIHFQWIHKSVQSFTKYILALPLYATDDSIKTTSHDIENNFLNTSKLW